jgi:flagellar basal-body rod protein FlgG
MIAQQQNVDVIAHNLSNVNTAGYKKERMEFKTLLYETLKRADLDPANGTGRPVNLQIGHGVRPYAVSNIYTQGNLQRTDNPNDVAIEGDGFYVVQRDDGLVYTKDGTFKLAPTDEGLVLTTSDGYPVLSTDDDRIIIPFEIPFDDVVIDDHGSFFYTDPEGQTTDLGYTLKLVQFTNMQGLENVGNNFKVETAASGPPLSEADGEVNKVSRLIQGTLEMSNVYVADEMVALIVAQRAYDLNSKAITTSDEMLQTANNLKR